MMLVAIVAVGSKVEAAMMQGIGTRPLQTESNSGIEKVGYYRRHAPIAVGITAMATLIMAIGRTAIMDTAIGLMVTTAGDQA
jgi:hypothetical protein